MQGMSNIKYEVKIITVENIKICRCLGDHESFELAVTYVKVKRQCSGLQGHRTCEVTSSNETLAPNERTSNTMVNGSSI